MSSREILLFAGAAELAAASTIAVDLPAAATAEDVLAAIGAQVPGLVELLPACRLAVDQTFVGGDFLVPANSELALIPPVSGG
jgi:molybdopterin converting factor small subunit